MLCLLSGHLDVVKFLTETCKVNPFVKDRYVIEICYKMLLFAISRYILRSILTYVSRRWANQPVDDALQFGHDRVVELLKEYQQVCSQNKQPPPDGPPKLETVEGML